MFLAKFFSCVISLFYVTVNNLLSLDIGRHIPNKYVRPIFSDLREEVQCKFKTYNLSIIKVSILTYITSDVPGKADLQ